MSGKEEGKGFAGHVVIERFLSFPSLRRLLVGAAGTLGSTSLEAVLESSGNVLEVAHAAGADGLSSLSLLAPVDCRNTALVFMISLLKPEGFPI